MAAIQVRMTRIYKWLGSQNAKAEFPVTFISIFNLSLFIGKFSVYLFICSNVADIFSLVNNLWWKMHAFHSHRTQSVIDQLWIYWALNVLGCWMCLGGCLTLNVFGFELVVFGRRELRCLFHYGLYRRKNYKKQMKNKRKWYCRFIISL